MWRAFLQDLLLIPGLSIVTTWDGRLPTELGPDQFREPPTRIETRIIEHPDAEEALFREACASCDASYVIAPELEDLLTRRVTLATRTASRHRNLNCDLQAIELCGDKWQLYEHFIQQGLPTIPTCRVTEADNCGTLQWPRVLKLRMGAGSQSMQSVDSPQRWENAMREVSTGDRLSEMIAQPLIRGSSHSMGVVVDHTGAVHLLPLADQKIDTSRGFAYLGGRLPSGQVVPEISELVQRAVSSIPGLRGYLGIDLLLPADSPNEPLIVEINPRLTTSYVGYRKLCQENLAALWIGGAIPPGTLHWRSQTVDFDAAGEFR